MKVTSEFDLLIIGAGIVGLATAHRMTREHPELRIVLVDKEDEVGTHQTGRNSGVLHTGIYYSPGSIKAKTCTRGRDAMIQFCQEQEIDHSVCGKIIVATDESEIAPLQELQRRAQGNGVAAQRATLRELQEVEPAVAGLEGLIVPGAGIVDYKQVAERLRKLAKQKGVCIRLGEEVLSFTARGRQIVAHTATAAIRARYVVNCGGLQSDRLAELGGARLKMKIVPFRGEYYELSERARSLVRHLIYPVPRPEFPFLGVHFTRSVTGHVECGPNAVLSLGRETYGKTEINWSDLGETLTYPGFLRLARKYYREGTAEIARSWSRSAFLKSAQKLLPSLSAADLRPASVGIRAQAVREDGSLFDDFSFDQSEYLLSVINAPSPAATSSLEIAGVIAQKLENALRFVG